MSTLERLLDLPPAQVTDLARTYMPLLLEALEDKKRIEVQTLLTAPLPHEDLTERLYRLRGYESVLSELHAIRNILYQRVT